MLGTASAATTLSVQGKPLMSSRPERLRFWRVLVALGAGIIEARLRLLESDVEPEAGDES